MLYEVDTDEVFTGMKPNGQRPDFTTEILRLARYFLTRVIRSLQKVREFICHLLPAAHGYPTLFSSQCVIRISWILIKALIAASQIILGYVTLF